MSIRIVDCTVVDVTGGELVPGRDVLIDSEHIDAVLPAGDGRPADAEIIDGAGLFLCPGLVDSHVHFFLDAGGDPRGSFLESTEEERWECAARNARIAIEAGITTMRDCAAPAAAMFAFQRDVAAGRLPGPHILSCGYAITRPAGHCHFLGGAEVTTTDEITSIIEDQLAQGGGYVKLMASGGGLTPGIAPDEVVAMATRGNAELLGLGEVGEVEAGQRADLILLAGNPFEDLDALRAPLKVIKSGRVVYDRQAD